jgi:DNA/RNA endonuclease G (NUC1)
MGSRHSRALLVWATISTVFAVFAVLRADIGIPTGVPYTQSFDAIGTTATAALPVDFRADRLTAVRTVGTFAGALTATTAAGGANLATNAANGLYNFGSGTTTTGPDRAIGFLSSGTATQSGNLYAQLRNTTGAALSGLQISYDVEKYRGGSNAAGFRIQLFYSTDGSTWTSAGSGFLTAFGADATNAGFATAPGATVSVTNQTLALAIPNDGTLYLAWNYSVATGTTTTNAQALAVDNISIVGVSGGDIAPAVTTTVPAAGAINVPIDSTVAISFSESVSVAAGSISLACPAGSPLTFTLTASPASTFTLTPDAPLPAGTPCQVTVDANGVTDIDGTPDPMAANYSFTFTTTSPIDTAPFVTSTTPVNGATGVAANAPIVVTFSESVTATNAFSIVCAGAPQGFAQSASPATMFTLTPASPLPYSGSCTVTVTANQVADTDGLPPATMLADVAFAFTTAAAPPPGAGTVRINEVDADTPGADAAEFIELYDGGTGNTPLDGLVVVLFEGGTGTSRQSYAAFDLDGYSTDANGYFVLGNPSVPGASLIFEPGEFGLLSNGPDAVGLYLGSASDFPNGTNTITGLQDAIVYGTDDPNASALLPLLNANQRVANENGTGNSQTQSNQRCPNGMGGFRNTSPYYPGAPTPGAVNSCPPARPPSDVVISQIYGGGGNGGATFLNDYVELYNRGASAADLTGWSLQYASATGSGWDANRQPLGGTIGAGEYLLVALASGGATGASLPPANITGLINMAAASGKVALVSSFAGLTGSCPIFDPTIQDFVGYGSADCGEGATTTTAGSNTSALFRRSGGSVDTDNNANDFDPPAAPSPRRTAPIVELGPNVLATDPRTNSVNAPRDATIQVTFTEPVDVDAGWFDLTCASSGTHVSATFAVSFGGRDHYITPNDTFTPGELCTVTLVRDRIHDVDLDDAGPNTDSPPADYAWSFVVAAGTEPPYPATVNVALGNPSAAGSDPANYLMEKPEFTLAYNRDLGRPNWVSWHISNEWIGTLTRVDTFRPDPQVPPDWYRVQAFDFSGSGFDRGHMTPNADRDKETSIPINQATFLMTNMVAQAPGNNQGPWAAFEGYLRTLVEQEGDEVYIVSGPHGVGGTGSNGGVTTTLANGHVTVPSSTWKVALVLPKDDGDDLARVTCSTRTIAVIMPNVDSIRPNAWEGYLTTVDAVETLTGYDLFSNLPEPYQQCIEAGTNGNNPPLVKGEQTIAFGGLADRRVGDPPFTVGATGGASGNPVTFAAAGACASSGTNGETITLLTPGVCTVTASQAGNAAYDAAADVVRTFTVLETIAPVASPVQSPAPTAGWNNTDVTVTWNWTDAGGSGIDPATCTTSSVSSGEGSGIVLAATCADRAGNVGTATYGLMVDKTPPVVSLTGGPTAGGSYYFGSVPAAPTCAASDALSGVGSCTVAGYGTSVGPHTVTATATDRAGNVSTASATYTVQSWTFKGFYFPVDNGGVLNTVRNGATVPLIFEVFAGQTELTSTSVVVQPLTATVTACVGPSRDPIELPLIGPTALRRELGLFIYTWKTPRTPGQCYVVTVTLTDGTSKSATFKLR